MADMDNSTQTGMPQARISYGASRHTHRDLREAQACGPRSQVNVPLAHPELASLPEQVLFVSWVWSSSSRVLAAKSGTSLKISSTEFIAAAKVQVYELLVKRTCRNLTVSGLRSERSGIRLVGVL